MVSVLHLRHNSNEAEVIEKDGDTHGHILHFTPRKDPVGFGYLMQYTGLKDKNAKEVYEGDVLVLNCGSDDGATKRHKITATIEWGERGWIANIPDKIVKVKGGSQSGKMLSWREIHTWVGMHHCLTKTWVKFEVVGNIYKNPELSTIDREATARYNGAGRYIKN